MAEHLVFIFVKQILQGLIYLHNQGIIHRDIKGGNLLLTKNGVVKLADFGYSTILNEKKKSNSIVGTSCWMAPEIIEEKGCSAKCDIWSLGSTIIELLTTQPPYSEFNGIGAMFRIVTDACPPLPSGISPNLEDFLLKCFQKDPDKRASAKELAQHPWMTTPNKKLVKKFINESDNSQIPVNLINEWKNNYRDNLSSITSSQKEDKEKEKARSKASSSSINEQNYNNSSNKLNEDERNNRGNKGTTSKGKRKDLSYPKQNCSKQNKLKEIGRYNKKNTNGYNKKGVEKKAEDSKEKKLRNSNLSLKNLSITKSPIKSVITMTPSNENVKNISFNDDNILYRSSKSIIAESENELNNEDNNASISKQDSLMGEIEPLVETLYKIKEDNVIKVLNDAPYTPPTSPKTSKNKEDFPSEIKILISELNSFICNTSFNQQGVNQSNTLFEILAKILSILLKSSNLTLELLSNFSIAQLVNLLTSKCLTPRILHIILNLINLILSKDASLITDIIIYQTIFHLSRYVHVFNEVEIKMEMIYLIHYCITNIDTLNLFLGASGLYLLTSLIDSSFLFSNDILIILSLYYLMLIFEKLNAKFDDIALLFINNKIYTRLNLIIIDILNNENFNSINNTYDNIIDVNITSNLGGSNCILILDRTLKTILKLTSVKKYLYIICNDKLINTLIQASTTIQSSQIGNLLRIFDNIMSDVLNLNRLENLGYIDVLIKLLHNYVYNDISNSNEEIINFNNKIIMSLINQLCQMIKLNRARSELFVMGDGIDIVCSLANLCHNDSTYTSQIVDILSYLIKASDYTRERLKQSKTLELIVQLVISKKEKDTVKDLSQIILDWMTEDRSFIEEYVCKKENFNEMFANLNYTLGENISEYLSMLIDYLRSSQMIEKEFFTNVQLIRGVISVLNQSNYLSMNDIHLVSKVVDFYELLIKNKKDDTALLEELNCIRTIERIKSISKENNFVIIFEKINKLKTYMNK